MIFPAGPHMAGNILRSIYGWIIGIGLFLLYDSCGTGIYRWVSGKRPGGIGRLACAPIAYGLVSPLLLGIAAGGLMYRPVLCGILALLAASGAREITGSFRRMAGTVSGAWNDSGIPGKAGWIALASLCFFFIAPPEINPDSMQYHLSFPQQLLD